MPLETLAQIGEFAGVLAVLVTVIVLVVQMRHANREARNQTAWRITESIAALTTVVAEAEAAELWCRGHEDFTALTRQEQERYICLVGQWQNVLLALYWTKDSSPIPAEYWEITLEAFARYYSQYPGFRRASEILSAPKGLREQIERKSTGFLATSPSEVASNAAAV